MWALQLRPRDLLPGRHPEAHEAALKEAGAAEDSPGHDIG
jgi:hypothetical protein